ncbi:HTH-type transcriptional repressor Bm3R1 [Delftia tsuruhatensis]|uniref:TetR/AcrR family transcriptional regulator n=1 Tax=Delftia tsuruhatensis TaxID=180282 RepID=UPI001E7D95F6|nr:TetR/AcrR family transcriptional regulator [Delftia tsuruhatensis]CAB5714191.1 HTH-type transcriptional repressor Bm3R1 [Delftia tsuruhatensis]CAC9688932.1 HTH-type transcriptional repressor Bm3R1 [Delftia tsuruhatensis]
MQDEAWTFFPHGGSRHVQTLRVALRLFVQKGFFNTAIQDLCAEAGVSIGFFYNHFADKEGIARELYRHLLARMNVLLDEIEEQHAGSEQRCRAVLRMLFGLTEAEPEAMGFVVNARHREFLPEEPAICSASAFVRMRGFVFAGMADGEIREMEPMVAASLMYGAAIRMICLRLDGIIEASIDPLFDALWDGVWRSLQPD